MKKIQYFGEENEYVGIVKCFNVGLDCGSGQKVSTLIFYPNAPSSNPAKVYNCICKKCWQTEEKLTKRGSGLKKF